MFSVTIHTKLASWKFEISNLNFAKDWKLAFCLMGKCKIANILEIASHRAKLVGLGGGGGGGGERVYVESIYVQFMELWPIAKFQAQIWQFWKSALTSQTAACRVKLRSISTAWGRKRLLVQILELWPMAKSFKFKKKNFPRGLTPWREACIGFVFWEKLLIDSLHDNFFF